jgi:hypothetical protein
LIAPVAKLWRKEGNVDETKTDYNFSADRLKLLWLLLRKRGIDFAPPQTRLPEDVKGQTKKESKSGQQRPQGSTLSDIEDNV